jgi:hypothetical protein
MNNSKKVEEEKVRESGTGEEAKGREMGVREGVMIFLRA